MILADRLIYNFKLQAPVFGKIFEKEGGFSAITIVSNSPKTIHVEVECSSPDYISKDLTSSYLPGEKVVAILLAIKSSIEKVVEDEMLKRNSLTAVAKSKAELYGSTATIENEFGFKFVTRIPLEIVI